MYFEDAADTWVSNPDLLYRRKKKNKKVSKSIKVRYLNHMGEINDEVHSLNNWGYKPEASHDGFVPNKPFKDVESKLPIMNYLKQSLSLLGNVSSPKVTTKDDVETQRRPLPLHKRNEVMLRDILSVNHKSEEESPLESALMFNQVKPVQTLDKQLAAINDATKVSVENLGVAGESDPIIIPRVPVTSDAESDDESASVVAFDVKDTNLDESVDEKTEGIDYIVENESNGSTVEKEDEDYTPLEDYVDPPEPSISQNSIELYLPSQLQAPLQPQEELMMRDIVPRMNLLGVSPVIRGSLGRQKRQRLTMPHEVVRVSLTTPPVFNVNNVPLTLTQHVPSSNARMFRTCEYFKHLEGKQKLLREKREKLKKKYQVQLNKNEFPMTEELSIIDMKGYDPYKYNTDGNSIEVESESENYLPRNISPESKTLKINDIEFEGDARNKDNTKCDHRRDSDSFFAIHYMTGSEMFERRLLPRPNAITKIHPRNSSASRGLMKTVRINDTSQHKKLRKYNSAPLERKVRPKSTDSFWESSRQKPLVKKVISAGEVNVVTAEQKPNQVTRQLTKTHEKSVAENDKSKLSLKRPPVTMVSLKTPNIEKTIKVTVSKKDIKEETFADKIKNIPPNNESPKSTNNIDEPKTNIKRKKSRSTTMSPKQISNKILEFPKEQSKIDGRSRQKPTKSLGRKRETVAMSNYRFKQNEFRDIQNKLKDENIMVSVNLIEKVLLENKTVV